MLPYDPKHTVQEREPKLPSWWNLGDDRKPSRLKKALLTLIISSSILLIAMIAILKLFPRPVLQFMSPMIEEQILQQNDASNLIVFFEWLPHRDKAHYCFDILGFHVCSGTVSGYELFKIVFHNGCNLFRLAVEAIAKERGRDVESVYEEFAEVIVDKIRPCALDKSCKVPHRFFLGDFSKGIPPVEDLAHDLMMRYLFVSIEVLLIPHNVSSLTRALGSIYALKEFALRVEEVSRAKQILKKYGPLPFVNIALAREKSKELEPTIDSYLGGTCNSL